jgi:hypothetical protein
MNGIISTADCRGDIGVQNVERASEEDAAVAPRTRFYAGWAFTALAVLFLAFDATLKLLALPAAVEATAQLGYPATVIPALGLIQLICLALYLIPRTAVIGAVLWTGYLGGAIATHVRVGNPLFSHVLFPIYVAALLWGGLWLRDRRVRAMVDRP